MNIFYLHDDPVIAAKAMTDKHVVKMILESAQLLSTAHRFTHGTLYTEKSAAGRNLKRYRLADDFLESRLYKATHINHPSAVWVRQSKDNYRWLYDHFLALCEEYTARYGKTHATQSLLETALSYIPSLPDVPQTPILLAIADTKHHVAGNPIQSYRNYYIAEKLKTAKDVERFYSVLGPNKVVILE